MTWNQIKWIRRFFRRNLRPVPIQTAVNWRERLSIVYMILAWNAFGITCYMVYTGGKDWTSYYGLKTDEDKPLSPAQQWAKTLKIKNAKVVTFSGISKTGEFEIDNSNTESTETKSFSEIQ